jgi:NO-binding membrane sensor protein with MHYT domain
MKKTVPLTITSLLTMLLASFHVTDDIVRGLEPAGLSNLTLVPILVVWLYAALVLAERRSGYVILLLGSILGAVIPVLHFNGKRIGEIAGSSGGFFFIWTLLAVGVTALFSVILSVQGLWSLRRR